MTVALVLTVAGSILYLLLVVFLYVVGLLVAALLWSVLLVVGLERVTRRQGWGLVGGAAGILGVAAAVAALSFVLPA